METHNKPKFVELMFTGLNFIKRRNKLKFVGLRSTTKIDLIR